jgi:hypothetical protein
MEQEKSIKSLKARKIVYWFATLWLALGMLSTGVVQILRMNEETDAISKLGYPVYILTIIGVWKLLGVFAILIPKFPVLKEWAYGGFFFAMTGAFFSHVALKHNAIELFGPALLIILTFVSWYLRPANRKLVSKLS